MSTKRKLYEILMHSPMHNNIQQLTQPSPSSTHTNVQCVDNHIYFYAEVNTETILELNKAILRLNKDMKNYMDVARCEYNMDVGEVCIYLHINSGGGYITDALSGVDTILKSNIPVISIVEGYVASAATLLSIVCAKRFMTKHSSMLIHQLSGGMWGTFEQMKDDMTNSSYLQKKIKEMYIEYGRGKMKKERLEKMLARDLMMNFKKSKKLGLVDELF
jgi:ATP-dependent protease ClpP protease subunit